MRERSRIRYVIMFISGCMASTTPTIWNDTTGLSALSTKAR